MKVPVVRPLSRRKIELLAENFLSKVQPECLQVPTPFDVERCLDVVLPSSGYQPDLLELGPGVEGLTDPIHKLVRIPPQVYEKMVTGKGRARFTVTHEVGHVVLHAKQVREIMVNYGTDGLKRRSDIESYRDPEWQANAFAAAVLMPESAVRAILAEGGGVGKIARTLKVSVMAAEIRLKNLGIKV
jgi:hypothetical protein